MDPNNVPYECYCHCGATAFKIHHPALKSTTSKPPAPVLSCDCSICAINGYLLIYVFRDQVEFIRGWDDLKNYEFASKTRDHKFCGVCGTSVAIDYRGLLKAGDVIGVNVCVPPF